ncbi:MAG: permease [Muribaculaceae bacterium]|nr:permease [Muribaculaceae bacterium]
MEYVNAFFSMLNGMSPYLLLGFLIAGLLHAFVPSTIYSRYLAGTGFRSVVTAALFGIPLPLCSCGVLPTAVALRRSGASRAASTSFLIATPQTGVDSIAATYSMMGLPFAILRPVAALVTSLLGGLAVGYWERKGALDDVHDDANYEFSELPKGLWNKILETLKYGFFDMMQSIGRWLLIGLVVATLITVLLPDDFFSTYARWPLLNMFIIVLVAVPMYVCATGSIPIAAALMLKGMSPGCALVLLMAGPAANLASMFVVNNAFGRKATVVYLLSIIGGAIGFGVLVDYWPGLREVFVNALPCHVMHHGHGMGASWFNTVCSIALLGMIVVALGAKYWKSYQIKLNKTTAMKEFKIKGMMCAHCKANVEKGLAALPGVEKVTVDLAKGTALVEGTVPDQLVIDCINDLGYQYEP